MKLALLILLVLPIVYSQSENKFASLNVNAITFDVQNLCSGLKFHDVQDELESIFVYGVQSIVDGVKIVAVVHLIDPFVEYEQETLESRTEEKLRELLSCEKLQV